MLLYCYVFFRYFCCPFLCLCSLVRLSRWYLGLCCPISRFFFFFSDSLSVTSARGHVQKAKTIWVYNTCGFYQKGRRYVCFMLWFKLLAAVLRFTALAPVPLLRRLIRRSTRFRVLREITIPWTPARKHKIKL